MAGQVRWRTVIVGDKNKARNSVMEPDVGAVPRMHTGEALTYIAWFLYWYLGGT